MFEKNVRGASMIIHRPVFYPGVLMPKQKTLEDKLGGFPWRFPKERWPVCGFCKKPMSFLAQFRHHPERLDLGKDGRVLFLFECFGHQTNLEDSCQRCFVLEEYQLTQGLTHLDIPIHVHFELRVTEWKLEEEPVSLEEWKRHNDFETSIRVPWEETEDFICRLCHETKLGGVPAAIQQYELAGYAFLGQLEGTVFLPFPEDGPNTETFLELCREYHQWSRKISSDTLDPVPWMDIQTGQEGFPEIVTSYGYGTCLIFKKEGTDPPEAAFLWDCE
jgi:hypothetical protein